jgi:tRNA A-37 threonylcarbamoyl transferase component Bud32
MRPLGFSRHPILGLVASCAVALAVGLWCAPASAQSALAEFPEPVASALSERAPGAEDAAAPADDADADANAANEEAAAAEPQPGLAEVTEKALGEVLDAARRDGRTWAQRVTEMQQNAVLALSDGWQSLVSDPIDTIDGWLAHAGLPSSEALAVPAALLVAGLLGALLFFHGKGDVIVSIEYPAELRGTFSVRMARRRGSGRKGPRTASPAAAERARRRAGAARRTERHLVSREADLREVPTGRWYVTVDGFVQPPDDEAVIATHFDEQQVRVRRGHTVRIDFDFRPKQCPVDVKVTWDKRPVNDALVAWRGLPLSLRYARGGPVRLGVERGEHVLVVGSGDRVAELPVSVSSFKPQAVELDLADRERLLFTGCPPAVEPYLHGDLPAAARALEREGADQVASLILARMHEERDERKLAAQHYAAAGHPLQAAEIYRDLEHFGRSAGLFEKAGELVRAAEMYRCAGDMERAAESFEKARDYEHAAACYREIGNVSKWSESLEKSGAPLQAARVALEHEEVGRAIRTLQLLRHTDSEYLEAGNLLVEVLQKEGHLDLAVEKIEEMIRNRGADSVPLETCDKLARTLEENEDWDRSLDVLEIIRRRDASYPEVASRIEALRKKRQQSSSGAAPNVQGADAFTSGFRYEILEELGRGGMGIVFKARDRRLGRVVALKRLPDNLRNHPKAVELFLREARSAAALNHPNIVTVHDAGQEGDTFYITMELLEGFPLLHILKRQKQLGPRDVAKLGIQVTRGLQYAHEQRIVHRDIKTGNLFFTRGRTLKIMDFGLAKMVEEVRRAALLKGFRGEPVSDVPAAAECLLRLSQLVTDWPEIKEIDVNGTTTATPLPPTRASATTPSPTSWRSWCWR